MSNNKNYAGHPEWMHDLTTGSISYRNAVTGAEVNAGDYDHVAINRVAVISMAPLAQFADGSYAVIFGGSAGGFGGKMFKYTGDIVAQNGTTAQMSTWSILNVGTTNNGFKSYDGSFNVNSAGSAIENVKVLASGAMLLWTTDGAFHHFIHRAAPTTLTIGNDSGGTNQRAVINLGATDGQSNTQSTDIRLLHDRSWCEATVFATPGSAPVKKVLVAEYNVNASRTPGGTNDQVICWISTDDALTFTPLLTFNAGGVHQTIHFHAVIQDPRTGLIYFLLGDVGAENGIIVWDGISAAPAANSSYATIAATPGWATINGNELCRYGDLLFGAKGIYSLPDADSESFDANTTAFQSMQFERKLAYRTAQQALQRVDQICPLIGLALPNNQGFIMGSLRTQSAGTANEPYFHMWSSYDGTVWDFAARVHNYKTGTTANMLNIWMDAAGNIILPGLYARAIDFTANSAGSPQAGSATIITATRIGGAPKVATFD